MTILPHCVCKIYLLSNLGNCVAITNPMPYDGNKKTPLWGAFLLLADGEGFEPPDGLPHQRFSRPPHSTALPTILNFFFVRRSFNLRFCSLIATDVAAHHSLAFGYTAFALLTRMQDRHRAPSANHPKLFSYFRRSFKPNEICAGFRTSHSLYFDTINVKCFLS